MCDCTSNDLSASYVSLLVYSHRRQTAARLAPPVFFLPSAVDVAYCICWSFF